VPHATQRTLAPGGGGAMHTTHGAAAALGLE
jgi:hypothetical protein